MTPADRILDRETAHLCDACDIDADLARDLSAPVPCTGCQRLFPRYALDTTQRCPTCPAADTHRCVIREGARSLVTLALAILTGAYLTAWDRVELDARADAAREAWIAALEAEPEADLPEMPGSLAWTEERGLCAGVSL